MRVIYRANDGYDFEREEDCIEHERLCEPKMFDASGLPTTSVYDAMIVYFSDTNQTKSFIARHEDIEIVPTGIDEYDTGWFYWEEDQYNWISEDMIKAIRNMTLD